MQQSDPLPPGSIATIGRGAGFAVQFRVFKADGAGTVDYWCVSAIPIGVFRGDSAAVVDYWCILTDQIPESNADSEGTINT